MLKLGLTGGIGSGKTFICNKFKELGVPIFNADESAKEIFLKKEIQDKIKWQLNIDSDAIDENGIIIRKKLADIVFADNSKLQILNSILHPLTATAFENWLKDKQDHKYILKEAAILFESGANKMVDLVITVTAPIYIRIARVSNRDNLTEKEIRKKIDSQWTDEEKIVNSSFVIVNDGIQDVRSQVLEIHKKIMAMNTETIPQSNKYQQVAEDTVKQVEGGLYKDLVNKSCLETEYFDQYKISYNATIDFLLDEFDKKKIDYKLDVYSETSLEAIYRLEKEGKTNIGILNFASAKRPGGGFLRGRIAQEETLARSSSLYQSLLKCPQYYENPEAPYYSDRIVYSPNVVFFKNDYGDMIPKPILTSVITCAAPNLTDIENIDHNKIRKAFLSRIDSILSLFADKGCKNIILGAWGCGVFKNDPNMVSKYFKYVVAKYYKDKFESINFSIYDPSGQIIEIFKK